MIIVKMLYLYSEKISFAEKLIEDAELFAKATGEMKESITRQITAAKGRLVDDVRFYLASEPVDGDRQAIFTAVMEFDKTGSPAPTCMLKEADKREKRWP